MRCDKFKFPSYTIVYHYYLIIMTLKEAIIFSIIKYRLEHQERKKFPYTISRLSRETGYSINTIKKCLNDLASKKLINIIEGDIYLFSNIIEDEIYEKYLEYNSDPNMMNPYENKKFTKFNFDLMRELELNDTQYAILHTHYVLDRKHGKSTIGKGYFIKHFRIKERQYKYIKSKLISEKCLYKVLNRESLKVNDSVKKIFEIYNI